MDAEWALSGWVGSAVLVNGEDVDGRDALALWLVSAVGVPTAAYVTPRNQLAASPPAAVGLLNALHTRALFGESPAQAASLRDEIAGHAGIVGHRATIEDRTVTLNDAVDDLRSARAEAETALARERSATAKALAPLSWTTAVGDGPTGTLDELRRLAGLGQPPGAPVVAEVLTAARVLRWVSEAWVETVQVRERRPYLQQALPALAPVPTRLAAAMGRHR